MRILLNLSHQAISYRAGPTMDVLIELPSRSVMVYEDVSLARLVIVDAVILAKEFFRLRKFALGHHGSIHTQAT